MGENEETDRDNFLEKTRVRKTRRGREKARSYEDGAGVRDIYHREPKYRWSQVEDEDDV